jgi:hypothetical protein
MNLVKGRLDDTYNIASETYQQEVKPGQVRMRSDTIQTLIIRPYYFNAIEET